MSRHGNRIHHLESAIKSSDLLSFNRLSGIRSFDISAEWSSTLPVPDTDDLNAKRIAFHAGPSWIKLLVADKVAGSIIGKSGKVITEIERTCNCIMKLSPGHTFFPGTQERIVVIAGSINGIGDAIRVILEKIRVYLLSEFRSRNLTYEGDNYESADIDVSIRAVVPNSAVSCIIGRGGDVHKEISRLSGAAIRIGDRMTIVHERVVQVTGSTDQCHAALFEISTRIQTDKNLREHLNVVYTKAALQSDRASGLNFTDHLVQSPKIAPSFSPIGPQVQTPSGSVPIHAFSEMSAPNMYAQPCSISLSVQPEIVSSSLLRRIETQTGASLRYRPSSSTVQISGVFGAVHTAHILLLKESTEFNIGLYTPPHETASLLPTTSTPSPTARHAHHL